MSTTPSFARLFAATAALAMAVTAPAQVITNFETISDYTNSDISFANGRGLSQTLSNVVYIQSMTYRFVRTSGASATNLSYYFVEWDATNNVATSLIQAGSISVPAIGSFTTYSYVDSESMDTVEYQGYDYLFNLDYATNASKTYAMVLVGSLGSSNLKLGLIDTGDNFPYGAAFRTDGVTSFASLTATAGTGYAPVGTDWGFSQIAVQLAVIPEPTTTAAGIGGLLVAGLIALRLHRRRQEQTAALVVAAK